jgi:hypothetical protein
MFNTMSDQIGDDNNGNMFTGRGGVSFMIGF